LTLATDRPPRPGLRKSLTGIPGLDDVTLGGLPSGRATLVCGGPGSGKTLLGISFLVNGALHFDEPGVLMTFEENADELAADVRSLGVDLQALVADGRLVIDYVHVERSEIEETGEMGKDSLTRHGFEEYVTDAVIQLDHRVHEQVSTRRLRVVKFRGSYHGTNEFPFLIDEDGLSVLPVTSLLLQHAGSDERISSGQADLDAMLGGVGYHRGSTVLLSGTAGTGKTTLAAHFVDAACARGERGLYFLFEESPQQMLPRHDGPLHQPHRRRRRPGDHRDDDLVADGHLSAERARGSAAAPAPLDLRPEIAGHGPRIRHAPVPDFRPWRPDPASAGQRGGVT
jgi:circadian clock protein KaiC